MTLEPTGTMCALLLVGVAHAFGLVGVTHAFGTVGHVQRSVRGTVKHILGTGLITGTINCEFCDPGRNRNT